MVSARRTLTLIVCAVIALRLGKNYKLYKFGNGKKTKTLHLRNPIHRRMKSEQVVYIPKFWNDDRTWFGGGVGSNE